MKFAMFFFFFFYFYLTNLHVNSFFFYVSIYFALEVLFPFTLHWKFPVILLLLSILAFHNYQVFSPRGIFVF